MCLGLSPGLFASPCSLILSWGHLLVCGGMLASFRGTQVLRGLGGMGCAEDEAFTFRTLFICLVVGGWDRVVGMGS